MQTQSALTPAIVAQWLGAVAGLGAVVTLSWGFLVKAHRYTGEKAFRKELRENAETREVVQLLVRRVTSLEDMTKATGETLDDLMSVLQEVRRGNERSEETAEGLRALHSKVDELATKSLPALMAKVEVATALITRKRNQ